ncbi:MAG TPA: hypothetical protein VFR88_11825, partial [Microlunatus sp.]|nr:hypothetical protein [Microlunatus sp.]
THAALAATVQALNEVGAEAATMQPHRDLTVGFVSDDYLTEYRPPDDAVTAAVHADRATFRGLGARQILARALVLGGFGLDAVDLGDHEDLDRTDDQPDQGDRPRRLSVEEHPVLVVAVSHHLSAAVQRTLADYVRAGGRLLLTGALPTRDAIGEPCTVLADALGLRVNGSYADQVLEDGHPRPWFTTVRLEPAVAGPRPEVRVSGAQTFDLGAADRAVVLVREVTGNQACAVEVSAGEGRAIVLACDYPADLAVYPALVGRLGVRPRWRTDAIDPGLVIAALADPSTGAELVHLLNVAPYPLTFTLWRDERVVTPEPLTLPARGAELLRLPGQAGI